MARIRGDNFNNDDRDFRRQPITSGGGGATVLLSVGSLVVVLLVVCGGGIYLIVRGISKASEQVVASMSEIGETATASGNAEEIAQALQAYERANGRFPPPYLKTKDGKPGLSWRVAILPFAG